MDGRWQIGSHSFFIFPIVHVAYCTVLRSIVQQMNVSGLYKAWEWMCLSCRIMISKLMLMMPCAKTRNVQKFQTLFNSMKVAGNEFTAQMWITLSPSPLRPLILFNLTIRWSEICAQKSQILEYATVMMTKSITGNCYIRNVNNCSSKMVLLIMYCLVSACAWLGQSRGCCSWWRRLIISERLKEWSAG